MTEEILPCPFCNNEPDWKRWEVNNIWQIKIFCDGADCHVHPSIFGNEETMTKIWNTRSQPKYKRVDLDEMKQNYAGLDDYNHSAKARVDGNNSAIDDIKSKYGDLYAEVK
jgi:hypothetical protein